MEKQFLHHVFFWLKNPDSAADRAALRAGLETLKNAPTVRGLHVGRPADRSREVIDSSYSLSLFMVFDDSAGEQAYQIDPIHLAFVESCKHLWARVVVYDTEAA